MGFFPESALPAESQVASKLRELYGFVPRMFRLQSSISETVEHQGNLLGALLGSERYLARAQKERILLAASAARRSSYGVALHEQMLRLLGVPESEIADIVAGAQTEGPDGELVALARDLVRNPLEFHEANIERLRQAGFKEPQIVEAVVLVGACALLNTIQFGTGAAPDFAARPIPHPSVPNKVHLSGPETRPIVEGVQQEGVQQEGVQQEGVRENDVQDDPDAGEVSRAQEGDLAAFETLVERHSQRVYRTLIGLLGNSDDAKDALQDTFLKAFQSLHRFERRARFSTWLVSIASNTGLQRIRERRPVESLDDDSDREEFRPRQIRSWTDDPEQMYSKLQRRDLVERAISRLPVKYRVVIMLRDVQQLSTEEAAAALHLSVPALKARLLRGRLMLREALAPHFAEGAQSA